MNKLESACYLAEADEAPFDKLHEECGVFGIYRADSANKSVVAETYHALYALQHRGQESCGIVVNDDGVMKAHKDNGLVTEVFTRDALSKIHEGTMAVGHCRYGTTGMHSRSNAQPLLINHQKGAMALAHNGNLTNAAELREQLEKNGAIFHCTSDTEVIAYIITQERLKCGSIEQAVLNAMQVIKGAYSLVVMSPTKLIACRDPHGFRPLCMGRIGDDVVFASESCALDAIGATFVRDIEAGEVVVVNEEGIHSYKMPGACHDGMCIFEFIYFARPDSVIDGSSVHEARIRAAASSRLTIRFRRMWSSACRIPGWMPPLGTAAPAGFPTASVSSRTSTSGAHSSSRDRSSGRMPCASS